MSDNLNIKSSYECGEGWHSIINGVVQKIIAYNENKSDEEKVNILQIKEKFGGLRIYVRPEVDVIKEAIEEAEIECSKTCEICGSKENVSMTSSNGWLQTLCYECFEKYKLSKNKDAKFYPQKH